MEWKIVNIYLDNASTNEYRDVDDIVVSTMIYAMKEYWQNPSSLYSDGRIVREEIDRCRANIAEFINAKPDEIIFTSGSSESNNMAIRGWDDEIWLNTYKSANIITTHIEHKSILKLLEDGNIGSEVHFCEVDEYGRAKIDSLIRLLEKCNKKNEAVLVSICAANNEIGTVQKIKDIADIVHTYNGVLHIDATQMFGKLPIDVKELSVDMMSVSGHKISPVLKGVGFLYKKNSVNIQPLIYGNQEFGFRGGTENTFGIIGLSKAIEYCNLIDDKIREMYNKRDYFIGSLEAKFGCKLNGHPFYRLPNNINVTFPQNIIGESLLYMLDMSGIMVSTGSACNSKAIEPSYVLRAIGLSDDEAIKTVRFTISEDITYEDIDNVINEIEKSVKLIESA